MKPFLDDNFLLQNDTAIRLYHEHAARQPIFDYHCHVDAEEIAIDKRFENITQLWLGGDHYKWRLMRQNGVAETYITGTDSGDFDKFLAFARTLPKAAGNPVHHFAALELKRYFGCDMPLTEKNAAHIWQLCNERLADADMSVRGIIRKSNVALIGTTDDPIHSLKWHAELAADKGFHTKVVPSFRPDKAINISKAGFLDYLAELGLSCNTQILCLDDLYAALNARLDHFSRHGCLSADHGLDSIPFAADAQEHAAAIFTKALNKEPLTALEIEQYQCALLLFLGAQYQQRGWVMQLHYGVLRNMNENMFARLGPDSGFDAIANGQDAHKIAALLNALNKQDSLPKTILYSLNPADNAMLVSIAACFGAEGICGRVQHGSAWWFNDTKTGMEAQLLNLASLGLLAGFVGMLTDSRSFLSYARHEYFRRILCNILGTWVENGEYPADMDTLCSLVTDICYDNARRYFETGAAL